MNQLKKKTGKRVLSFMLVIALLMPMIPATVYADEVTPAEKLQAMVSILANYRDEAMGLKDSLSCMDETCEDYGTSECTDITHKLLVPEADFDAAVNDFKEKIDRDLNIVNQLTSGVIMGYTFANKNGSSYYNGTAASTDTKKIEAAISFLEKGGYHCGEKKKNFLGIPTDWKNRLGFKSSFNEGYNVDLIFGTSGENAVLPLAEGTLNILQVGATPDATAEVYSLMTERVNRYIAEVEALKGTEVPESGMYTQDEFDAAIESFLTKARSDLNIAALLVSGELDETLASIWVETAGDLKQTYKNMSDSERQANAIHFFNEGGYAYGFSFLDMGFQLEYKSAFHPNYSSGLFGVMANKANAIAVMRDTAAALKLGNRYMTPIELAEYQYHQSLARLQAVKEDPSGIVAALLDNDQELKSLIADLNTIVSSLDDIISTMETLERLGIGKDILDPILSQAGLSYDMLEKLADLRDTLEGLGIDTSGDVPIEESFDDIAGPLVGSLIDLAILGANTTASLGTESAYKAAASALDATYNSLMENAAAEVSKLLEPISAIVEPIRPYLGMLNSTVSLVSNVAELVEQVDKLQDEFTAGGLSEATDTTADTLDDLADFLEAFQAAGLGELFNEILENSNLGGSVADGTAAMLNQLVNEMIGQDLGLSGSDLEMISETVDALAQRGLENPTSLVPMLRASADVLRRAAELEGGIQDAIDGDYESAWNKLTKDLGGMISKTVALWNTIVALYEEPEVQEFASLTMNRQTGELNLDSLEDDAFLKSFAQGVNEEAKATFKVLIDPDCSHSEKLARVYKFCSFLKDVKTFISELEDASKRLNEVCDWAKENLTEDEANAFVENVARHYAKELQECVEEGLNSSSVQRIIGEIEDCASEMRNLLNYIKCTGELEILATPGEDEVFYTLSTNYDDLRDRLDDVLHALGISTGFKVNSPSDQFIVEGNKLIAIGELQEGEYEVKVSYQMYFAVCQHDFASTLATKWVTVNVSGGGEEPERVLTGIEITVPPSRHSYNVGESLDLAGLEVTANYDDETEQVLDLADCVISPSSGSRLDYEGDVNVTVSYGGFSDSFSITVKESKADIYTVRFDTDGGVLLNEAKASLSVEDGKEIILPWAELVNHSFDGWFNEDEDFVGTGGDVYTVRRDIQLIAKWTESVTKEEFTVTFVPKGGSLAEGADTSVKVEAGSTITLPAVTRSGYTFKGWYDEDSLAGMAGDSYTVNKDSTLEARWSSKGGGGGGSSSRQILDEEVPLGGIYALMSLPAEPKDGIVYYVNEAGEIVFVPFCFTIEDKIYFLGQVGIEYHVKANPKKFGDIDGNWSYENILSIASREAFQGYPGGNFQPGSPMTRAMLSTVLARMAMIDTSSYTIRVFDDVSPDAWYGPSVAWAYEQGIVNGVGGKQFNPDANITRQEFSVMLSRFISFMNLRLKSETTAPFADEDQASTWAKTAAADMKKYGIVTGKPGNLFDPNSDITRAEISAMLYRLIEASVTYEYESDSDSALKKN